MSWIVYRRGKGSKTLQSAGSHATKKEAQDAVKEGRKYQKEYTWSYASDRPWTDR